MGSQIRLNKSPSGVQPQSLWEKALAGLDGELLANLNFSKSSKHDVLKRTLETAEQKKQLCLIKRWKFERNGKEIVLRDVLQKIIHWLDRFRALGDAAVQYDPGHASLPWAGVRFLLQVSHYLQLLGRVV